MFEWHWATVTQLSLGNSENDENVSRDSGSDSELQKKLQKKSLHTSVFSFGLCVLLESFQSNLNATVNNLLN